MSTLLSKPPYHEIFDSLITSVMRAQAEIVRELRPGRPVAEIDHELVNRHFAWMPLVYREGINRHLFEAVEGGQPIRIRGLRRREAIPPRLAELLLERLPLPHSSDPDLNEREQKFMRDAKGAIPLSRPTRISQLVVASFGRRAGVQRYQREDQGHKDPYLLLKSPLSIVYDFLTVPTMGGSRAYALLAVRNFLFETFGIYPDNVGESPREGVFTVPQLESALSHIWTSFRERHNSKGWDPIPAEGRVACGGMLRHFLAARGVLWLRFHNMESCLAYLGDGVVRPERPPFEFARSDFLERLPDLGEIVNELWGLPIPIRGADTIFRGGLKFSSRRGLIVGIHGGAGSGKTSLALALGAFLAPLGIRTLFLTGEEAPEDLHSKAQMLIPDELRRLSFFPRIRKQWLSIQPLEAEGPQGRKVLLDNLDRELDNLARALRLNAVSEEDRAGPPKVCRAVVVLDGIHDLISTGSDNEGDNGHLISRLREFVLRCRELRALVIMTAADDWAGNRAFDYLVDVAMGLEHEAIKEYGRKPDRHFVLTKARHQLCAVGTHGIQIAGSKGVRFSPQINYQLDRRAMWRTRLPEMRVTKKVLSHAWSRTVLSELASAEQHGRMPHGASFEPSSAGVSLFRGSNVFLNGEGSGAKAALALKIALSPTFGEDGKQVAFVERILIVSFLYPEDYYSGIRDRLLRLRRLEYPNASIGARPHLKVIHLYPGNYRADQLFNRIEWELDAAELNGDPYTTLVIDGLHNVFLQFPEIEGYTLFWPQLYASLRSRPITIISTHTTFVLQGAREGEDYRLDDRRTEPLRHALVQKTDFRFEIDPAPLAPEIVGIRRAENRVSSNVFTIKTVAAINQPIPARELLWSRDNLVLFEAAQGELPLSGIGVR